VVISPASDLLARMVTDSVQCSAIAYRCSQTVPGFLPPTLEDFECRFHVSNSFENPINLLSVGGKC
jgi:hypothetical protein